MTNKKEAIVIGGGLAGVEAAKQLSKKGIKVTLYEMKPRKFSPAHKSEKLAELVCSNSLKAERLGSAAGLLKAEMRLFGSVCLDAADVAKVPAGGALAVDRDVFSHEITKAIENDENMTVAISDEFKTANADASVIVTVKDKKNGKIKAVKCVSSVNETIIFEKVSEDEVAECYIWNTDTLKPALNYILK